MHNNIHLEVNQLELNSNYHINLRYLNMMWYRTIAYLVLLSRKCIG